MCVCVGGGGGGSCPSPPISPPLSKDYSLSCSHQLSDIKNYTERLGSLRRQGIAIVSYTPTIYLPILDPAGRNKIGDSGMVTALLD